MMRDYYASFGADNERAARIFAEDAVLEYPQSGERIRGKANIVACRQAYPGPRTTMELHRTTGGGDVWVNECTIRYGGENPHRAVGIMEFRDGLVSRERIYIAEPWEPPAYRAPWVERMLPDE
jgi:hypothetical protein